MRRSSASRSSANPSIASSASATTAISPLASGDVGAAVATLHAAGFGGQVGRLLGFPAQSPAGVVLATADRSRGRPLGVACCASFGSTGWIGALGVLPDARGAGLGTELTNAAVDWLRARGAETVLLYATEAGRRVYERLGFVAEGRAVAWQGVAPMGAGPALTVRSLRRGDRHAMADLDAATTGERRSAVLGVLSPPRGRAVETRGRLRGFAAGSPWGQSVAVCAADEDAGLALMAAVCEGPEVGTLIVPEANEAAARAVRDWDLQRANSAERMRLGPALHWHPARQFGLFNLFWG